jgi:hypothetical protein
MNLDEARAEIQRSIDDQARILEHLRASSPEYVREAGVQRGLSEALQILSAVTSG